jgi:hypothetical protein
MMDKETPNEWERVKETLVATDARLRAFTDREVKYYLREDFATVTIYVVMLIPKMEKARMLQMSISRLDLVHPAWQSARVAHVFIDTWIEKLKMERTYEELDVMFDGPPSWAPKHDIR